jgi:hypothetical protein
MPGVRVPEAAPWMKARVLVSSWVVRMIDLGRSEFPVGGIATCATERPRSGLGQMPDELSIHGGSSGRRRSFLPRQGYTRRDIFHLVTPVTD